MFDVTANPPNPWGPYRMLAELQWLGRLGFKGPTTGINLRVRNVQIAHNNSKSLSNSPLPVGRIFWGSMFSAYNAHPFDQQCNFNFWQSTAKKLHCLVLSTLPFLAAHAQYAFPDKYYNIYLLRGFKMTHCRQRQMAAALNVQRDWRFWRPDSDDIAENCVHMVERAKATILQKISWQAVTLG